MNCERTITVMRPSVRWPDVLNASFETCVLPYQHPGQCSSQRCHAKTGGGGAVWWCNMALGHDGDHIGERIDISSPVVTVLTNPDCPPHCTKNHDHALIRSQES